MKIQIEFITEIGTFKGEVYDVTEEQYVKIIELSKEYYKEDGGMEMHLEDGSFAVFSPDIVKKSIYKVNYV